MSVLKHLGFFLFLEYCEIVSSSCSYTAGSPVHLEHEVWREIGYSAEALCLGLMSHSTAEIVPHHLFACPLG